MGKADEIITALEAVDITSFTEFSGFMWNTQHYNDHIEELSVLKKKEENAPTIEPYKFSLFNEQYLVSGTKTAQD